MAERPGSETPPISLEAYREFRLELEAKVRRGDVFAGDVERIKHEFAAATGIANIRTEEVDPNARRQRSHRLRRARITLALSRELEARVS